MNDEPNEWASLPVEPELTRPGRYPESVVTKPIDPWLIAAMAIGGVIGTLSRVAISQIFVTPDRQFPWPTLCVNVAGSLLLGFIFVLVLEHKRGSRFTQPFFAPGVCGSLTTFSTLIWQAENLARMGEWGTAIGYVAFSLAAGIAAVILGMRAARTFVTPSETP